MVLPIKHKINSSELTPDESKSINKLLEKAGSLLKKKFETDPIIFLNTEIHSTHSHLHFHILPSKNGLRELFGETKREQKTINELKHIQTYLTKVNNHIDV